MKHQIEVRIPDPKKKYDCIGIPKQIDVKRIYKGLAVHRSINAVKPNIWTVTHIKSGYAVWCNIKGYTVASMFMQRIADLHDWTLDHTSLSSGPDVNRTMRKSTIEFGLRDME